MADPWEQNWSQPTQGAPWEQDWTAPQTAPQGKSFVQKLGETWPARLVQGVGNAIYSAATLPGDVYSGKTQVDPSDPEFIGRTLDFAGVTSPVAPRAAITANMTKAPTVEALEDAATKGYNQVRDSGVEYKPEAVSELAQNTAQKLEQDRYRAGRAPETHAALAQMGEPPPGAVSTIDDLQYAKQVFGDIVANPQKYTATDRKAAGIAKRHIDDFLASPPKDSVLAGDAEAAGSALRAADRNYAAAQRSQQITGAQEIAEGNAAAANSGRNIDNAYRQRFNSILKSDKQSLGFSPDEIARMEALRNGTATANTLRYTGNLLSGLGGQAAGAVGSFLVNPLMASIPMVGHVLKKGADYSTVNQIRALDEATRLRSALGESFPSNAMTPAEQLRQSAMIKALMGSGVNQTIPQQSDDQLRARILMQAPQ